MRIAAVVPAYEAQESIGRVIEDIRTEWPSGTEIIVVDDGSTDETGDIARQARATVLSHSQNLGKGAAIKTALSYAQRAGFDVIVTLDADSQHPASEAYRLASWDCPADSFVLGTRNLAAEGAPRANRISNWISNFFLSLFMRRRLADTQCGMRRYPVQDTLALGARDNGYAYEAEVLMRAIRAGRRIEQVPIRVVYPSDRRSHFHVVRDPARIISRVLRTMFSV